MNRYYSSYKNVDFTIEMHKSMWCDDFMNYHIKDLFSDGKIYQNLELLNCSEKIKENIRCGRYYIYPMEPNYFENRGLGGYIYIGDTLDGMRIFYEEPIKKSNQIKTDYTGERFIK